MKHTRKKLTAGISAAAAVLLCGAAMPFAASAESVEDVYEAMRRIGLPESMVQEAKIQYQNTEHDDEGMTINETYLTYDVWADMVELYEDDIRNEVGKQFGVSGEAIKEAAEAERSQKPAETQPASENSAAPAETAPAKTEKPAVSVEPPKPFVNMTLDEKIAVIGKIEDVKFVKQIREETEKFVALIQKYKNTH